MYVHGQRCVSDRTVDVMRSLTDDEDFVTIKGPWLSNVSVATWGDNGKNVFFLWSPGRVHIINEINEEYDEKRKKIYIYTFKYIPLIIMWGVIFM